MCKQKEIEYDNAYEKQEKLKTKMKMVGQSSKTIDEKIKARQKREHKTSKKSPEQISVKTELLARRRDYVVKFEFKSSGGMDASVIDLCDVSFQYPGMPILFENVNFGMDMKSRITVVGPNGVGKSTLLNIICCALEPTSGDVRVNRKLRIGRYNQHFADTLPMDLTPIEYLTSNHEDNGCTYQESRQRLGKFGLAGFAHTIPIKDLSGGQKARVVFTHLSFLKPHILILDEPTNHLDIESINALIDAINKYDGGVLTVTHDARFILETNSQLWICKDHDIVSCDDGFEKYREDILKGIELQKQKAEQVIRDKNMTRHKKN
jgi:ATP-binding cassette subfamily F protein 1